MEGQITSFRRNRHTQHNNQMIIHVEGVDSMEKAGALVGKSVTWTSPANKVLRGKIAATHGGKGSVRAIFEIGMPGQSLAQKVQIE